MNRGLNKAPIRRTNELLRDYLKRVMRDDDWREFQKFVDANVILADAADFVYRMLIAAIVSQTNPHIIETIPNVAHSLKGMSHDTLALVLSKHMINIGAPDTSVVFTMPKVEST